MGVLRIAILPSVTALTLETLCLNTQYAVLNTVFFKKEINMCVAGHYAPDKKIYCYR